MTPQFLAWSISLTLIVVLTLRFLYAAAGARAT